MKRADIIRAEIERIRDRVPAWLEAEGAPRGRFTARCLDVALRRHGYVAPGTACRMLRRMRDDLVQTTRPVHAAHAEVAS